MNRHGFALLYLLFTIIILSITSCNLWKDFADPNKKDALIEEAKFSIDRGDYETAIEILDGLATSYPADSEIATLRSSAYAGAAQIGLLDIGMNISSLSESTDVTASPLVPYLALVDAPQATEMAYAILARDSLTGYSPDPAARTNEMNMYLTILSYGTIGSILSATGDTDPNDNNTDTGYSCSSISDDNILEIILTYAVAKQSIAYAEGSSLWEGIETQVSIFTDAIEALGIDLSVRSKSEISNLECTQMKTFIVGGMLGTATNCTCSI